MNVGDLQAAVDGLFEDTDRDGRTDGTNLVRLDVILEAVGIWLNPNVEAAAEVMYDADDPVEPWVDVSEDEKDWYRRMTRIAVFAALSSRGDTE